MTCATLMVHLEIGNSNAARLQIAGDLAERFHADVIGIAASQMMQMVYGDGYVSGDLIEVEYDEIEKEMKEAEAEFRSALQQRASAVEWRSTTRCASIADYVAGEARRADLVITGTHSGDLFDGQRRMNTSDLVMQLGRAALIVPSAATEIKLDSVVVGWKDTREARRAVLDALPLLKKASHVAVVEIATDSEQYAARTRLGDVAAWLHRHGVTAETIAALATGDDALRLNTIAKEQKADVIVAGAYGHSRLREWALGGMTRALLMPSERCSFVSH